MTFFDMNSRDTFNDWIVYAFYDEVRKVEWPQWLTCPEHYKVKVETGIDWGKEKDFTFYLEPTKMSDPGPTGFIDGVTGPEEFVLSVRDTNNLVRFLYTNGWISRESHPDVHILLDEMITWLERQGIKVDMNMERM